MIRRIKATWIEGYVVGRSNCSNGPRVSRNARRERSDGRSGELSGRRGRAGPRAKTSIQKLGDLVHEVSCRGGGMVIAMSETDEIHEGDLVRAIRQIVPDDVVVKFGLKGRMRTTTDVGLFQLEEGITWSETVECRKSDKSRLWCICGFPFEKSDGCLNGVFIV